MTAPTGLGRLRLAGWLVLLAAAALALLASVEGARARWAGSQALDGGAVTTGTVDVQQAGPLTFEAAGTALDPATHTVCVGDVVHVAVPVRVLATGTTMTPTLSRSSATTGGEVTDVDLDAVSSALSPSPEPQDHVVHLDVTVPDVGTTRLREDLTVSASPGSGWTASLPVEAAITARRCGTLVSSWDTTLRGVDDAADASISVEQHRGSGTSGTIDWGDGSPVERLPNDRSQTILRHDYAVPGTYSVALTGQFGGVKFGRSDALTSVDRWDPGTGTTSIAYAFREADNLRHVAAPPPTVTDMQGAFSATTADPVLPGWDTSRVTTMREMFEGASQFTGDVSSWDTSQVTDMRTMFSGAASFDGDLSGWDTSEVTAMSDMFRGARSFTSDLSRWDTSDVTTMRAMFSGATAFTSDLSEWDTSRVEEMSAMFSGARTFTSDLSRWTTSRVTSMSTMFSGAALFDSDLSDWDTSLVRSMASMFSSAESFTGGALPWDTAQVKDMESMFSGARQFDGDIAGWDTSQVAKMDFMFSGASAFTGDLSGWDVTLIPSEPRYFRDGASAAMVSPIWGTAGSGAAVDDLAGTPDELPAGAADVTASNPTDTVPGTQVPDPVEVPDAIEVPDLVEAPDADDGRHAADSPPQEEPAARATPRRSLAPV